MKISVPFLVVTLLAGCSHAPAMTENQKVSYAIGYETSQMFKEQIEEQRIDIDLFIIGIEYGLTEEKDIALMNSEEIAEASKEYARRVLDKRLRDREEISKENLMLGQKFRDRFSGTEGVFVLENGIMYKKLIASESGDSATLDDSVLVNYTGYVVDEDTFDSWFDRGESTSFNLSQVILGWKEILQKMKEGDKWRVVIPPELAYGERGVSQAIGPDATLLFDIELVAVNKRETQ